MKWLRGSPPIRKVAYLALGVVLFAIGVALSYAYDVHVAIERHVGHRSDSLTYVPSYERQFGPQLLVVYVGSSTCPWSNEPQLPGAIQTVKTRLAGYASARGLSFKALGISLDWSAQRGTAYLAKFGLFDEISAGYNWGNSVAMRYSDASVPAATPMVLAYTQTLVRVAPRDSVGSTFYEERDRRLVLVKRGTGEITAWADSGAPLPAIEVARVMDGDRVHFATHLRRTLAVTTH